MSDDAVPTRLGKLVAADVRAAMELLRSQGFDPSLRRIRNALGNRGSYDTIAALRREIEGRADVAPSEDVPPPMVAARMSDLAPEIWRAACASAREAVAGTISTLQQQLQTTRAHEQEVVGLLAEADERLQREAASRAADQERLAELTRVVASLTERLDATVAQHAAASLRAETTLTERDTTIHQLAIQVATATECVAGCQAAAQAATAQLVQADAARERLEESLAAAIEHQAQEQRHSGAALDLARQERDRALGEAGERLRQRDLACQATAQAEGSLAAATRQLAETQVRLEQATSRIEQLTRDLALRDQAAREAATGREQLVRECDSLVTREDEARRSLAVTTGELMAQRLMIDQFLARLPVITPVKPG